MDYIIIIPFSTSTSRSKISSSLNFESWWSSESWDPQLQKRLLMWEGSIRGACHNVMSQAHVTMLCPRHMSQCYVPGTCHNVMSQAHVTMLCPSIGTCHNVMSQAHVTMLCPSTGTCHNVMSQAHVTMLCPRHMSQCYVPV